MSDQINREYRRLLENYKRALQNGQRHIVAEIDSIDEAINNNLRFHVRHGLRDLATSIEGTDYKLELFSQFVWDANK